MKALGIDYDFPGYTASISPVESKKKRKENSKRKRLEPIRETVRDNSNSVPGGTTWNTGERQGCKQAATTARNYLTLFEIRHEIGTTTEKEQTKEGTDHNKIKITTTIKTIIPIQSIGFLYHFSFPISNQNHFHI